MQTRAAQGFTYTAFLQKRKMLWRIRSLAVQIEASTSPECLGNRNEAKLEVPRIVFGGSPVSENNQYRKPSFRAAYYRGHTLSSSDVGCPFPSLLLSASAC